MLTTDWLIERLPADAIAMIRFFGSWKMCSLRKVAILSTPAFVRVSANITRPSRTRIPQQYVIDSHSPGAALYHLLLGGSARKRHAYWSTLTAIASVSPPEPRR